MIALSQKAQYALRSVFELALRGGDRPTTISDIAAAQAIPPRFLELILYEMKQKGIVSSRRGMQGGYLLSIPPDQLTIGQIIRLVEGPIEPVKCISTGGSACPMKGDCVFSDIWDQARDAIDKVFEGVTYAELVQRFHARKKVAHSGGYSI